MDPGPEGFNNVLSIVSGPWAGNFEALLVQPREEHLQHSVSPPNAKEKLKLVERVTAMGVTLLLQVVHHYTRDLARQADALLQDIECFTDPQIGG
jgi:hypothetical protein